MEDVATDYIPAYSDMARANIRSLERAVSVRRNIIEKPQPPSDERKYAALNERFEAQGAKSSGSCWPRNLIHDLIETGSWVRRRSTLGQLESRVDVLNTRLAVKSPRNGAPAADTR